MTTQHTPGPWHKRSSQLNNFDFSIYADDADIGCSQRTWIAEVRAVQPILASDANARLIAASPDLLAALQHLLADAKACDMDIGQYSGSLIEARAAIAKATGA